MPNPIPFHPYAETYPLLEGEEYESFKADIAAQGVRETLKYRLVNRKKEGLDGRNRLRACTELGIPCPEEQVQVDDADVENFIDSLNLHRRHLNPEQRQERVLQMRARGQSIRTIAETVGVSAATVHKDIKDAESSAGVQNRTPENNKPSAMSSKTVAGKDGKTYSSRKPRNKKTLPCERCARCGTPSCDPCRTAFPEGFPKNPDDATGASDKPPKNGAVLFDIKPFEQALGALVREIDRLGNAYKVKESAEAQALRSDLSTYRDKFHRWYKTLSENKK